jgi:NAD(P)-dependent dehydrogenase (short-subunit alcohol dehydrogenase family)
MGNRLKDKIAIIAGAGQTVGDSTGDTIGNGRATAILFAREGARCVCVDRRLDSAQDTCAIIEQEGGEAIALGADVTRAADCKRIAETCVKKFGRIDILHNNVGIAAGDSDVTNLEEAAWDRILATNLKSDYLMCKEVIPLMRQRGGGSIVNISSIASLCSMDGLLAYTVSKAGVNSITHQMALANAKYGIRINAILPGQINTQTAIEALARARGIPKEKVRAERVAQIPLGKEATGWDVAYAALFLASDEARLVTGVLLPVDGGQSRRIG